MGQIKLNTALWGVAVLVVALCGSGYTLKCYNCVLSDKQCTSNISCPSTDDACLVVTAVGSQKLYSCLPYNSCNAEAITKKFNVNNFSYHCCQKDLCNNSVMTTVNKTIFSLITLLALIWICF